MADNGCNLPQPTLKWPLTASVFPESNNHGMADVGRGLWRSSSLNTQQKQVCIELLAQDCVQTASECLQGGDSTPYLGKVFHYLVTCMAQKCFLMLRQNLWCCTLCPLPLVLALPLTRTGLCLCTLPSGIYYYQQDPPLSLFSRLNSPGSLSHSSQERCSRPSLILTFHCSLSSSSLVQGGQELDMVISQ